MMYKRIISLVAIFFGIFNVGIYASLQLSSEPAWILNPGDVYDERQYLMAVGSGEQIQAARDRAMSNLSQIFQANVQAEEQLLEDFSETFSNSGEYSSSGSTRLLTNIRIGTQQSLMNTQVLDSYKDESNIYYVLVGMKRQPAGLIYSQEISNNEITMNRLEERADTSPDTLEKMGLLRSAILLAQVNDDLIRQLSIIRGTGIANANSRQIARLQSKFDEIKDQSVVHIRGESIPVDLLNAVSAEFQKAGFVLRSDDTPLISVDVSYEALREDLGRSDAEFVRFILNIQITDVERNRNYRAFNIEEREGGLSLERANSKALYTARTKIAQEFSQFLRQELLSVEF